VSIYSKTLKRVALAFFLLGSSPLFAEVEADHAPTEPTSESAAQSARPQCTPFLAGDIRDLYEAGPDERIAGGHFSPDGRYALIASYQPQGSLTTGKLIELKTGRVMHEWPRFSYHQDDNPFSVDGKFLGISVYDDESALTKTFEIAEVPSGKLKSSAPLSDNWSVVGSRLVSSSGTALFSKESR
jgi:hypothetical protein